MVLLQANQGIGPHHRNFYIMYRKLNSESIELTLKVMENFVIRRKNCEMLWGIGIMNLKLIKSIKMKKNESEKVSEENSGR